MTQLNEIKNKIKRQQVYHKNKLLKKKKEKTKTKQIPKTQENLRPVGDEDMITERVKEMSESEDEILSKSQSNLESQSQTESDKGSEDVQEFNETLNEINQDPFSSKSPKKILVTTSKRPTTHAYKFTTEFTKIFPDAQFIKRQSQFSIQKICELASQRDYTAVIVVNEDHKQPNKITIINLPYGPTAHFNLSSITLSKDIHNHAKLGIHKPELVLNGFSTRLGQTVGRMFASLFPDVPEFEGRQVCTLHNQRDFIFFRRHRYIFRNGEKCDIQEIGPRFTLKLEFLQKGIYDMKFGEYEWKHKPELDTSRQKFHL